VCKALETAVTLVPLETIVEADADCINLLKHCLQLDWRKRASIGDLLAHEYFREI